MKTLVFALCLLLSSTACASVHTRTAHGETTIPVISTSYSDALDKQAALATAVLGVISKGEPLSEYQVGRLLSISSIANGVEPMGGFLHGLVTANATDAQAILKHAVAGQPITQTDLRRLRFIVARAELSKG